MLLDGAGFRGGSGVGGEYEVNGCVAKGLKFDPLRGETGLLEVIVQVKRAGGCS